VTGSTQLTRPHDGAPSRSLEADREALLNALPRVVAEHGWASTSVARVTHEAGVPPHEFWNHYRSLEHLFVEVYDRMLERVVRTTIRAVASRPLALGREAWQDQLEAIMTGVLAFFSLEPALAKTCLVDVLDVGPAARARRDDALARFASYVEGLRLSHGDPMPPIAAEMIVLGTTDLIYTRVARGEAERLLDLLPNLRRMWRASVTTPAGSATNPLLTL